MTARITGYCASSAVVQNDPTIVLKYEKSVSNYCRFFSAWRDDEKLDFSHSRQSEYKTNIEKNFKEKILKNRKKIEKKIQKMFNCF